MGRNANESAKAPQAGPRRAWTKPEIVVLDARETAGLKLNVQPSERFRSGISYAPS